MIDGKREADEERRLLAPRPARINRNHVVADVLAWYPQTLAVFLNFGFSLLANRGLRRTLAAGISIERASALRDVDLRGLLDALNAAVTARREDSDR